MMNERSFENFVEGYRIWNMQAGNPAIAVAHPLIGNVGTLTKERGFQLHRGMGSRAFHALLRDEEHFRENPSHGRWKHLVRRAREAVCGELGAITGWSDIVTGRRTEGQRDDFFGYKASLTTVANCWSSFARSAGLPGAASFTNLAGAVLSHEDAGAWPLRLPVPSTAKKFLLNVCCNHASGTNWVCVVDLLYAGGSVSITSTSTQTGNIAPTRYTDGRGVQMILEITTAAGSTASNVTMIYDDVIGTNQSTGAQAMTASCRANRLNPATGAGAGLTTPLVAGGKGVKKFVSLSFSASMGGSGVAAICQFKPLILMPTLAATVFVERAVPSMMLGFQELVYDSTNHRLPFITFFVQTSTTSTGVQSYYINTGSKA